MRITFVLRYFFFSNITVSLLLLSFMETLQGNNKPAIVAGAANPDKHFKGNAFNELWSRQRLSKRRIRTDLSTLKSRSIHSRRSMHGCDVDEYWNSTQSTCTPCTRCSHEKAKTGKPWTLRGCGFDRDTECGTILDLRAQLEKLSHKQGEGSIKINTNDRRRKQYGRKNRSHKSNSNEDDNVVYGFIVTPLPPSREYSNSFDYRGQHRNGHRRKVSAHHKLKETVRNLSQGRDEFLKQIQEEDNMALEPNRNYDEDDNILVGQINYGEEGNVDHYDNDYDYEPEDYGEYPKLGYDVPNSKEGSSLHQEIARIKSKLDNDPNDKAPTTRRTISLTRIPNQENYNRGAINRYITTATEKSVLEGRRYSTINGGKSYTAYPYEQGHDTTTYKTPTVGHSAPQNKTTSQVYNGHTWYVDDFIDGGGNDEGRNSHSYGIVLKDHEATTEMGIFGAVMKQPPKFGEMTDTLLEPVDILGRWLTKNNTIS